QNQAGIRHRRDHAVGQNAVGVGLKRERHNGVLRMTSLAHPDAENTDFYRLSDDRLDGKGTREYQHDLSRGDLSRPACSHVKEVAKQAGDSVIPACGIFPGRFFCDHFQWLVTMEVTCLSLFRPRPIIARKPGWSNPEPSARNS